MKKVLLIDNFDSFVHNLADEFAAFGYEVDTYRANWDIDDALQYIAEQKPDLLVLSPGPGTPAEATLCNQLLESAPEDLPIFGVCLGHQCIVEHFGGVVSQAAEIVHGKASRITHDGTGIFANMENNIAIGRYHSLVASAIPETLYVNAHIDDQVMAVQHTSRPIIGVQFHPESILSTTGNLMIKNLLGIVCKH